MRGESQKSSLSSAKARAYSLSVSSATLLGYARARSIDSTVGLRTPLYSLWGALFNRTHKFAQPPYPPGARP